MTCLTIGCGVVAAQRWFFDARSGLHPYAAPGKCLDVPGSQDANQARLQIYDCNQTPAQQWSAGSSNLPIVFNPINKGIQSRCVIQAMYIEGEHQLHRIDSVMYLYRG